MSVKAVETSVIFFFAESDAIRDAQKEEIVITKENVLYEVPTSVIKVAEVDTQEKKKKNLSYELHFQMMMTECQAYEVPSRMMKMTECQAYGFLPNKP